MRYRLALLALAIPTVAVAQSSTPYKLVVAWSQGGIATVDYPSSSRCELARKAVEAERVRRIEDSQKQAAASGGVIVGSPWTVYGFCIPG